jgi:hypothetical protein
VYSGGMAIDVTARNARLDALQAAATAWATSQTKQLNATVTTLQAILQGRTGANSLPATAVDQTSQLVVNSISDFLGG